MNYTAHEFANIFPMMTPEEHAGLVENIRQHGFDSSLPVILFQDKILDGRNRFKACNELGITPPFKKFEGDSQAALDYVMRTNLDRRQLSPGQLAAVGVEYKTRFAVLAKERQLRKPADSVPQKIAEQKKQDGEAREQAAKAVGTNRQYIDDAEKVKWKSPQVFEAVKQGKVNIPSAKVICEMPEEQRKTVLKMVDLGVPAKHAIRELVVSESKQQYSQAQAASIDQDNKPIVYLGDCLNHKPPSIDLLLTDPPYSTDIEDIESFVDKWLPHVIPSIKPTGRGYICIGAYPKEIAAYLIALRKFDGLIVDNPLIWTYRNTLGKTPKDRYNLNYQMVLHVYYKTSNPLKSDVSAEMFSVQDINAPDGRQGDRLHTWQKPEELAMRFLRHGSNTGDTVFDPFACTGTFLVAASKMGRKAIGYEIKKEHADIAESRGCMIG